MPRQEGPRPGRSGRAAAMPSRRSVRWQASRQRGRWCRRVRTWWPNCSAPRPGDAAAAGSAASRNAQGAERAGSRTTDLSRTDSSRPADGGQAGSASGHASVVASGRSAAAASDFARAYGTRDWPPPPVEPARGRPGDKRPVRQQRERMEEEKILRPQRRHVEAGTAADQPRDHHLRRHHGQGAFRKARRQGQPGDEEAGGPRNFRHHQPDAGCQAGRRTGARFRRVHQPSATKKKPCRKFEEAEDRRTA